MRFCLVLALLSLPALPAQGLLEAHDLGTSESRLDVDGRTVRVALLVNAQEFKYVDQDRSGTLSVAEVDEAIPAIFAATKAIYRLRGEGEPTSITLDRYTLLADGTLRMDITYGFSETIRELSVSARFSELGRADHKHALTVYMDGRRYATVLDAQRPVMDIRPGLSVTARIFMITLAIVVVVVIGAGLGVRALTRPRRSREP